MTHTAMTAMGRWYERERGRAVSITSLGHQIGDGVLPIVVVTAIAVLPWTTVWLYAAGLLILPAFISTSFFFHQQHIGEDKLWSQTLIATAFSAMAISNVVSSLIAGQLIDRFSAKQLLPVYLLPLCVACIVLSLFSTPTTLWVYMILLGVSSGTSNTLLSSIWPEVYGTRHLGAIRGTVMAGMVFSSALGPGVTGWFIDRGVPYSTQTWAMAAFCLLACLFLTYVSRELMARSSNSPLGR